MSGEAGVDHTPEQPGRPDACKLALGLNGDGGAGCRVALDRDRPALAVRGPFTMFERVGAGTTALSRPTACRS